MPEDDLDWSQDPPGFERDPPLWLHLLSPLQQGWREKQILKGRNPDPHIEKELREAGVWPPKKPSSGKRKAH